MTKTLSGLFAPLLSLFILVLGTGFSFTLFGVILTVKNASPLIIGAITGIFYAGLVLGSIRVEHFIARVGHIRAYAVFSSTIAITYILQGLYFSVSSWLILRFIAGFVTAGLYVVIESWLLYKTSRTNRGQILSLYMIIFYASQSLGQFFLKLNEPGAILLFAVSSMLCSLSIIPISMTRLPSPTCTTPSTLGMRVLLEKTGTGLLGALVSGMIMGALYGLLPSIFKLKFHDNNLVANFMFTVIIGGMLLQYPIGRISDLFERRRVFIFISMITALATTIMFFLPQGSFIPWYFLLALLGGLTFTLYPISIAHACDALNPEDLIAGTQSLLLAYSLGAMIGPLVAPLFMLFSPEQGFFYYLITITVLVIPPFLFAKSSSSNDTLSTP